MSLTSSGDLKAGGHKTTTSDWMSLVVATAYGIGAWWVAPRLGLGTSLIPLILGFIFVVVAAALVGYFRTPRHAWRWGIALNLGPPVLSLLQVRFYRGGNADLPNEVTCPSHLSIKWSNRLASKLLLP